MIKNGGSEGLKRGDKTATDSILGIVAIYWEGNFLPQTGQIP